MLKIPRAFRESLFFACLWVLELSLLLIFMALHKKGEKPLLVFLYGSSGIVFVAGVFVLVMSAIVIASVIRNGRRSHAKSLSATFALNLWSVVLVLLVPEAVIRVFAVNTPAGPVFADTPLLPQRWENVVARNRAILAKVSSQGSYLIFDNELGWTIGRNQRSKNYNTDFQKQVLPRLRQRYPEMYPAETHKPVGKDDDIYFSSVEGIRSPRVAMTFSGARPKQRIAIIGDSFTFGLEVPYEDTWGHQLELALGSNFQVLNFGVDGYGIDQSYLRYQKHVLLWRPDIVIFGLVNDDFRRTMCVYGFLCFPGSEIPFPKPRFVVNEDTLTPLNLPLPAPESIFAWQSITQIPFIEYDRSFEPNDWDWGFYDHAYSMRFLLSKFPRWPVARPIVSDEALKSVNGHLLRSFVRLAEDRGSKPIVVFFPSAAALAPESNGRPGVAREVLHANHIPYLDMTGCVSKVDPAERFVVLHYSAMTNAAIAECLREALREGSQ